jgi:hypothetical protein
MGWASTMFLEALSPAMLVLLKNILFCHLFDGFEFNLSIWNAHYTAHLYSLNCTL